MPRRAPWLAGLLLAVATAIAYSNSLNNAFVFDDVGSIVGNPTIRQLWPPWDALVGPPGGATTSGRPVVNFSFAINYALGGLDVRGYHVFNILIHVCAGLTLFGLVRRLLERPAFPERVRQAAFSIAFASAALWLLHPLQSAAVTYTIQRAEALVSLFYLLTAYCFLRSTDSPARRQWEVLSVASCAFAMASKEVAVSAPLLVLLLDRTLISGTFAQAWKQRRGYYLALASTWLLLIVLIANNADRGGSVGTSDAITPWSYALTQCRAIVHYLRLAVWPHPLVFDYGTETAAGVADVFPQAVLLIALVAATITAIVKRSVWGIAGAWFFAVLAPSSSLVPVLTQTMAEHRMYLPLAALIVPMSVAAFSYAGRGAFWALLIVSAVFGGLTFQRNRDYANGISIWTDTVEKRPNAKRAYNNLATALLLAGRGDEAAAAYQSAIQLDPEYVSARVNLGRMQVGRGHFAEAAENLAAAVRLQPDEAHARNGLGVALNALGRSAEALPHFAEAVRLVPESADFRLAYANALLRSGQTERATEEFQELLRRDPNFGPAHTNLGTALAMQRRLADAERALREAVRLNPADPDAHFNLANVLVEQQRLTEALPHYDEAARLQPQNAKMRETAERLRAFLRERS